MKTVSNKAKYLFLGICVIVALSFSVNRFLTRDTYFDPSYLPEGYARSDPAETKVVSIEPIGIGFQVSYQKLGSGSLSFTTYKKIMPNKVDCQMTSPDSFYINYHEYIIDNVTVCEYGQKESFVPVTFYEVFKNSRLVHIVQSGQHLLEKEEMDKIIGSLVIKNK